ncbi:MAG: hypothetical protein HDQ88_08750 [Clostridia bacterium]|nr:hypothetical protein [Clostridia bacterium]
MGSKYVIRSCSRSIDSKIFLRIDTDGQTGQPTYRWVKEIIHATTFSHPKTAKINWERYVHDVSPNLNHPDIDYDIMVLSFTSVEPLNNYDERTRPDPDKED